MTGATLFSGIHAPECAAPEIDWKFCAEIEAFPSAVGAARHPLVPNLGDVTAADFIGRARAILNGSTLDVLVFGSPCQGFSVAGKRLGLDDPRSNLALHALRIVRDLAPAWFVFENVPGLFSTWSGAPDDPAAVDVESAGGSLVREFIESADFAEFIQRISDIGYCGAWTVLDAQHFGVAQRRERVFFVGHSGDWRGPAAVLLEPESLCGDPPTREKTGQGPAGSLAARTRGGGGLGTDFDLGGGLQPCQR
jgi:DNA (cytosine-5)-methyltransferase 1